jgi:galactokinase
MDIKALLNEFTSRYGENNQPKQLFFSPGRVNLIGEHTDYNGGYVFPCSLSFGTYLVARKTNDNKIKFASTNFSFTANLENGQLSQKQGSEWVNYPLGVIAQFAKKGFTVKGLELLYSGNIPNGAGLSSSASIELVTAVMINNIFNCGIDMVELVKIGQKAENEFVGMNCGIMDQFAVGMGKANKAIFLNCDTLAYDLVPLELGNYKLVIANTNKQRKLTDSKYNERRAECDKAVELISTKKPVKTLGEVSEAEYKQLQSLIPSEIIRKRAKHVITEIKRVEDAVGALKSGDLVSFGKLMNASHDSLRDDYEVTGVELDTLVDEARKIEGVLGSRMTGAGFGGCTVSLVRADKVDEFCSKVKVEYQRKTGLVPDFYIPEVGDGARELKLN